MSAIPAGGVGMRLPYGDKVAHFTLYAVLGATLAWGRARSAGEVRHGWLLTIGLLYAASDEWHQMYVPGRSPALADWLADAAGLLAGYGTTAMLLGRTRDGWHGTGEHGNHG